jgi:prepilin-type N-terminal cleavage/methylation domain-containing protein
LLPSRKEWKFMTRKQETGFTLMETMVSLVVLLVVSAIVMGGMNQMMQTQGTIANRTEMHTSVRGATELMEQEIGQAGKVSLQPGAPAGGWLMTTAIFVPTDVPVTQTLVSFSGGLTTLFDNEQLLVDTGTNQETITITCPVPGACTTTWTAGPFYNSHAVNVPISTPGAFAMGVVPPVTANAAIGYPGFPNGSTATTLKLFGDINGDGNMLYVEYSCVQGTPAAPGFLYRNQMAFDAAAKPGVAPSMAVLTSLGTNPNDPNGNVVPCFTYQVQTVGICPGALGALTPSAITSLQCMYVTDVAVTLTEQTQNADPQTHQIQSETKALLNVAPRNVFDAYLLARQDYKNRVQPMPLKTFNLLP